MAIVEETPDPHGRFWVTPEQAERLVPRIKSAPEGRLDPYLLSLLESTRSGESQPDRPRP